MMWIYSINKVGHEILMACKEDVDHLGPIDGQMVFFHIEEWILHTKSFTLQYEKRLFDHL